MSEHRVKFGLIGLGGISHRFAKVLNSCEEAQLYAVAARSRDRAEQFAKEYGADVFYETYQDLMKDPDVDIIYIGLTHNFHYQIAKQCLEYGKAVLCEKPLVLTKWEAEDLVKTARQNNVLLMEAMWTRCLPATLKMKEWLRNNQIGAIKYLEAQFSFHADYNPSARLFNPDLAGGALYDAGVYPLEYVYDIMGDFSQHIHSMHTVSPTGVDDFDVITMQYDNGAIAHMVCGISLNTLPDAYIYGENGYIIARDFLRGKRCELYDCHGNLVDFYEEAAEDGFIYQIQHVMDLFRNHQLQSPYIPWKDNIACASMFEKLIKEWNV